MISPTPIVGAAPSRSEPSLREIFARTAPKVLRFLRYLGVHEGELEDALQEVFVVAHRRMGELRDRAKLEPWLRGIALNVARNQRRATGRRRDRPVGDEPIEIVSDDGPHEELERRQARQTLGRLLEQLSEEQRVVIVLYEIEQLPMKEIAETIGCPLQTAYSRLHAARDALRRAWSSQGEGVDG